METQEREQKLPDDSGRLNTVEAAIFAIQKGQLDLHKKHRQLREQISTVRTNINKQTHNDNKERKQ